jgi:ketosteroid isomerase-like protein
MQTRLKCAFLFLIILGFFQCEGPRTEDGSSKEDVLNIEKMRFKATVDRDVSYLEKVMADDLYYVHSNGEVDTKETYIKSIADGNRAYDDISIDEAEIRIYDNTAIINGICTYYRQHPDGSPNNLQLRYTNVYVKNADDWKMVSWQSLRMDP